MRRIRRGRRSRRFFLVSIVHGPRPGQGARLCGSDPSRRRWRSSISYRGSASSGPTGETSASSIPAGPPRIFIPREAFPRGRGVLLNGHQEPRVKRTQWRVTWACGSAAESLLARAGDALRSEAEARGISFDEMKEYSPRRRPHRHAPRGRAGASDGHPSLRGRLRLCGPSATPESRGRHIIPAGKVFPPAGEGPPSLFPA
jgi:hypothetical protein